MRIIIILLVSVYISESAYSQVFDVGYYDTVYTKVKNNGYTRELKDSLQDGIYNLYFPCDKKNKTKKDCSLFITGKYENSLRNGIFLEYQINDELHYLSSLFTYKNGVLNGIFIAFTKNGDITLKGLYENGVRTGEWQIMCDKDKYLIYYKEGVICSWQLVDNNTIIDKGFGTPKCMLNFSNQ